MHPGQQYNQSQTFGMYFPQPSAQQHFQQQQHIPPPSYQAYGSGGAHYFAGQPVYPISPRFPVPHIVPYQQNAAQNYGRQPFFVPPPAKPFPEQPMHHQLPPHAQVGPPPPPVAPSAQTPPPSQAQVLYPSPGSQGPTSQYGWSTSVTPPSPYYNTESFQAIESELAPLFAGGSPVQPCSVPLPPRLKMLGQYVSQGQDATVENNSSFNPDPALFGAAMNDNRDIFKQKAAQLGIDIESPPKCDELELNKNSNVNKTNFDSNEQFFDAKRKTNLDKTELGLSTKNLKPGKRLRDEENDSKPPVTLPTKTSAERNLSMQNVQDDWWSQPDFSYFSESKHESTNIHLNTSSNNNCKLEETAPYSNFPDSSVDISKVLAQSSFDNNEDNKLKEFGDSVDYIEEHEFLSYDVTSSPFSPHESDEDSENEENGCLENRGYDEMPESPLQEDISLKQDKIHELDKIDNENLMLEFQKQFERSEIKKNELFNSGICSENIEMLASAIVDGVLAKAVMEVMSSSSGNVVEKENIESKIARSPDVNVNANTDSRKTVTDAESSQVKPDMNETLKEEDSKRYESENDEIVSPAGERQRLYSWPYSTGTDEESKKTVNGPSEKIIEVTTPSRATKVEIIVDPDHVSEEDKLSDESLAKTVKTATESSKDFEKYYFKQKASQHGIEIVSPLHNLQRAASLSSESDNESEKVHPKIGFHNKNIENIKTLQHASIDRMSRSQSESSDLNSLDGLESHTDLAYVFKQKASKLGIKIQNPKETIELSTESSDAELDSQVFQNSLEGPTRHETSTPNQDKTFLNPDSPEFKPGWKKRISRNEMRPEAPEFNPSSLNTSASDLNDSLSKTEMRIDAPEFNPANFSLKTTSQTLESLKKSNENNIKTSKTFYIPTPKPKVSKPDKGVQASPEIVDSCMNTRRVKTKDSSVVTVSCNSREVSVNTDFSGDTKTEFPTLPVKSHRQFACKNTNTDVPKRRSIAVSVNMAGGYQEKKKDEKDNTEIMIQFEKEKTAMIEQVKQLQVEVMRHRANLHMNRIFLMQHKIQKNRALFSDSLNFSNDRHAQDTIWKTAEVKLNMLQATSDRINALLEETIAKIQAGHVFRTLPDFTFFSMDPEQNRILANQQLFDIAVDNPLQEKQPPITIDFSPTNVNLIQFTAKPKQSDGTNSDRIKKNLSKGYSPLTSNSPSPVKHTPVPSPGSADRVAGQVVNELKTAGKRSPNKVLFSPSAKKEVISSPHTKKEVILSPDTKTDVISSPDTKKEMISSPVKMKEVISSPVKMKEMVSSPDTKKEMISSPDTMKEVISSPDTQKEEISSPDSQKEVISSPDTQKGVMSSPDTKNEVIASPDMKKQVLPSPDIQKEVIASPDTKKEMLSSPDTKKEMIVSPDTQRELISRPDTKKEVHSCTDTKNEMSSSDTNSPLKGAAVLIPRTADEIVKDIDTDKRDGTKEKIICDKMSQLDEEDDILIEDQDKFGGGLMELDLDSDDEITEVSTALADNDELSLTTEPHPDESDRMYMTGNRDLKDLISSKMSEVYGELKDHSEMNSGVEKENLNEKNNVDKIKEITTVKTVVDGGEPVDIDNEIRLQHGHINLEKESNAVIVDKTVDVCLKMTNVSEEKIEISVSKLAQKSTDVNKETEIISEQLEEAPENWENLELNQDEVYVSPDAHSNMQTPLDEERSDVPHNPCTQVELPSDIAPGKLDQTDKTETNTGVSVVSSEVPSSSQRQNESNVTPEVESTESLNVSFTDPVIVPNAPSSSVLVVHGNNSMSPTMPLVQSAGTFSVPPPMVMNSIDPVLFNLVFAQLMKAYPHLAANPDMLCQVAFQQTSLLQHYIASGQISGANISEAFLQGGGVGAGMIEHSAQPLRIGTETAQGSAAQIDNTDSSVKNTNSSSVSQTRDSTEIKETTTEGAVNQNSASDGSCKNIDAVKISDASFKSTLPPKTESAPYRPPGLRGDLVTSPTDTMFQTTNKSSVTFSEISRCSPSTVGNPPVKPVANIPSSAKPAANVKSGVIHEPVKHTTDVISSDRPNPPHPNTNHSASGFGDLRKPLRKPFKQYVPVSKSTEISHLPTSVVNGSLSSNSSASGLSDFNEPVRQAFKSKIEPNPPSHLPMSFNNVPNSKSKVSSQPQSMQGIKSANNSQSFSDAGTAVKTPQHNAGHNSKAPDFLPQYAKRHSPELRDKVNEPSSCDFLPNFVKGTSGETNSPTENQHHYKKGNLGPRFRRMSAPQSRQSSVEEEDWDIEIDEFPQTKMMQMNQNRQLHVRSSSTRKPKANDSLWSFSSSSQRQNTAGQRSHTADGRTSPQIPRSTSFPSEFNDGTSGLSDIPYPKKLRTSDEILVKTEAGDKEDEWCEVTTKKKKQKELKKFSAPYVNSAPIKSQAQSNFERLIDTIQVKYPSVSRVETEHAISKLREQKGGTLKGMNLQDIVAQAGHILEQMKMGKQNSSKIPGLWTAQRTTTPPKLNLPPYNPSLVHREDEEICVICHDPLSTEETKSLDCKHVFHSGCINQWVYGRERTCPTCRQHALFPEEFPRLGK